VVGDDHGRPCRRSVAFLLNQNRGGRCEELTLGAPLYIVIVELAGSKEAQRVTAPYLLYGTRRSMPARAGLPWAPAPQQTPPRLKRHLLGAGHNHHLAAADQVGYLVA
jgi:hypothetical protein